MHIWMPIAKSQQRCTVNVYISNNPVFQEQTKYFDVDCQLITDKVLHEIVTPHTTLLDQIGDIY